MRVSADINYFDTMATAKKHYTKLLDPICKEWELTRNELDVILFLYNNPEYDRAADIVSRRGIVKSHVSLSVANLEKKELLVRRFDENDRRTAHLELKPQGRAIASQAKELQLRYFDAMFQGISEEETLVWKKIILKVQDNIQNFEAVLK